MFKNINLTILIQLYLFTFAPYLKYTKKSLWQRQQILKTV